MASPDRLRVAVLGGSAASCLVVILVLVMAQACSHESSNVIRIGAVLPLTGGTASYGIAAKRGIDLAFDQLNTKGGINGRRVSVTYEDDQGQATAAVAAMQKLISVDKVPVIMGSAGSSVTLAFCLSAGNQKVVVVTPISSAKELSDKCGPFFFRVCPSDVVQAGMMAQWFADDGRKRAGVIFVNNSWGQGLKEEFISRFPTSGGQVVAVEACNEGTRDLRAQLTKVNVANPDALYAITYGKEGGALLRQARELGFNKPIYGADVWGSPELVETAKDAAKGVKIIVPSKFQGPRYQDFAQAFQRKYGELPDTYASYSYDMAMIIASALSKASSGDPLRAAIANTSYEGVTGLTEFDEHGNVKGKGFERKSLP